MNSNLKLHTIVPVLSSSDIDRDIDWYNRYVNFKCIYKEEGYAVLNRDNIWIHLQFHYGTKEDPIFGSVVKIFVENIHDIFSEMKNTGIITKDKLRLNTPWKTHEFAFFDLNKNAVYFVQDI